MLTYLNGNAEAIAFVNAVAARPLDNLPKGVFADWLDEQGHNDWATLIRLQTGQTHVNGEVYVAGAATNPTEFFANGGTAEQYADIHRRIQRLMPIVARASGVDQQAISHGGFFFRSVQPDEITEEAIGRTVKECRDAGWLPELNLYNKQLTADTLREMQKFESLNNLTSLNLEGNRFGEFGLNWAVALSKCDKLSNLVHLDLGDNDLQGSGALALGWCNNLSHLKSLDLRNNNLRTVGIAALSELNGQEVTDADGSKHHVLDLKNLTSLNLSFNSLGAAGIVQLRECKNLCNLTHLDISRNTLGFEGMEALVQCDNLQNLVSLNIRTNGMTVPNIQPLVNALRNGVMDENGTHREVFPHIQRIEAGRDDLNAMLQNAIKERARRLHPDIIDLVPAPPESPPMPPSSLVDGSDVIMLTRADDVGTPGGSGGAGGR